MLIGARNAAWGGKKGITAKNYVQDGLVAMWDGIENAGLGRHDANATVWKDLSGNGHDALCASNGPGWEDNCCIVLPTTQVVSVASYVSAVWKVPSLSYNNLYPLVSSDSGYTIELVLMQTSSRQYVNVKGSGFFYGAISTTWYGENCHYDLTSNDNNWDGRFEGDTSYLGKQGQILLSSNSKADTRNGYSIVVDFRNKTTAAYYNGIMLGELGFACVQGNKYGRFAFSPIISAYEGNRTFTSRLYSRALTAEEIAHNYEIDKTRFGL